MKNDKGDLAIYKGTAALSFILLLFIADEIRAVQSVSRSETQLLFQTNRSLRKPKKKTSRSQVKTKKSVSTTSGIWAGNGIVFSIERNFPKIEFDCAEGEISRNFTIDEQGNFSSEGFYLRRYPGALRVNLPPKRQAVTYGGKIEDDQLMLKIIAADSDEIIRETTLQRSKNAKIRKCC